MALTPEQCEQRTILKILAGSHVHGLNIETSDEDHEAIVIEPLSEAVGLGLPWEDTERIRQADGQPDVKYFSLRKWCRMASRGNPNFLLMLFAPTSHILKSDARGGQLRDLREIFLSKQSIKSHLGYMQGQRSRLINHQATFGGGGGRGKPRFELIEKYGYDTKFGMHLLRLGLQGVELARHGRVTLPMQDLDREMLLSIRRGEQALSFVLDWANTLEAEMKAVLDSSTLPDEPNYAEIEAWMQKVYIRAWSADRAMQDRIEDMATFAAHAHRSVQ